ncbi:MAG: hypothetical protein Q4E47_01180 [Candidatus Saccharibacteria bacterium]|nr:hypothetical protein [Candidatus Saccharibacteria bacterium]
MPYSGNLLKINGTTLPGIKGYKVTYAKLWKDAERNMNGDISASLIGLFPKIELTFRDGLTENEISNICNLLDQPYFNVTYYDFKTKNTVTAQYYAGDYTPEILDRTRSLFKAFTVALVPCRRR